MKKIIFITLSLSFFFSQFILAQSYSGAESVEFDVANNRYLVSNINSDQIIARAANGTLSVFATCASSPYGIEIVGDTLYCCTSGSITAIQLTSGSIIFTKLITGSQFINGIAHDQNGNLYITDFNGLKVYRFNTLTRTYNTFISNTISKPNGIIYDTYNGVNPRLVMVSWGNNAAIRVINLADSSMTTATTTSFSNIDGIAKGKNGNFYISSWGNNSIQRYDSTFANPPTAMVTSGLSSGPADIYYNQLSDTLAVPYTGGVKFYYFGDPTGQTALQINNSIAIYPNPSNGLITIVNEGKPTEQVALKLYEIATGKLIINETIGNLNRNTTIDLTKNKISAGIYLVELSSTEGIIAKQKLTIE